MKFAENVVCTKKHVLVLKMFTNQLNMNFCPASWGCRIHLLLLCRGVRPPPYKCLGYDTKQSDGEAPVMLELWGIWSTPSFPSLPGPLCPRVVVPDRVISMDKIEVYFVLLLNWIVWNRTVYMSKNGFGINDLQWLMCHKAKPNQIIMNLLLWTWVKKTVHRMGIHWLSGKEKVPAQWSVKKVMLTIL